MGCILMLRTKINATFNCQIDALTIGTWSCKERANARSSFETGRCFAGLACVGPFENSFVTDATTNLNMEEDLSLKDKALLFETDTTTNLNVAEDLSRLIWFDEVTGAHTNDAKVLHETLVMKVTGSRTNNLKMLHETFVDEVMGSHTNNVKTLHETFFDEVTGSHTNNVKMLHETFFDEETGSHDKNAKTLNETFFDEVTDSNPVWEWTQQYTNPELRLERKVAKGTRADITRLLCFGPCQLDGWVFDESVLSLWISLSCPWLLNITRSDFLSWRSPPFDEKLTQCWFANRFATWFIRWFAQWLL
jgi:hypothetical protein